MPLRFCVSFLCNVVAIVADTEQSIHNTSFLQRLILESIERGVGVGLGERGESEKGREEEGAIKQIERANISFTMKILFWRMSLRGI